MSIITVFMVMPNDEIPVLFLTLSLQSARRTPLTL